MTPTTPRSETYSMQAHCANCGHDWAVDIPKGTPVIVFEKQQVCPNCELGDIDVRKRITFR